MKNKIVLYVFIFTLLLNFSTVFISAENIEKNAIKFTNFEPDLTVYDLIVSVPKMEIPWWRNDLKDSIAQASFNIKVKNIGGEVTLNEPIYIELYLDDKYIPTDKPLKIGGDNSRIWKNDEIRTKTTNIRCWPVDNQTHKVTVKIDTTDIVDESNEDNNEHTVFYKQNVIYQNLKIKNINLFDRLNLLFRFFSKTLNTNV